MPYPPFAVDLVELETASVAVDLVELETAPAPPLPGALQRIRQGVELHEIQEAENWEIQLAVESLEASRVRRETEGDASTLGLVEPVVNVGDSQVLHGTQLDGTLSSPIWSEEFAPEDEAAMMMRMEHFST